MVKATETISITTGTSQGGSPYYKLYVECGCRGTLEVYFFDWCGVKIFFKGEKYECRAVKEAERFISRWVHELAPHIMYCKHKKHVFLTFLALVSTVVGELTHDPRECCKKPDYLDIDWLKSLGWRYEDVIIHKTYNTSVVGLPDVHGWGKTLDRARENCRAELDKKLQTLVEYKLTWEIKKMIEQAEIEL